MMTWDREHEGEMPKREMPQPILQSSPLVAQDNSGEGILNG